MLHTFGVQVVTVLQLAHPLGVSSAHLSCEPRPLKAFNPFVNPKAPSTNIIRTLGFCTENYYGLGQILIACGLGPLGKQVRASL